MEKARRLKRFLAHFGVVIIAFVNPRKKKFKFNSGTREYLSKFDKSCPTGRQHASNSVGEGPDFKFLFLFRPDPSQRLVAAKKWRFTFDMSSTRPLRSQLAGSGPSSASASCSAEKVSGQIQIPFRLQARLCSQRRENCAHEHSVRDDQEFARLAHQALASKLIPS